MKIICITGHSGSGKSTITKSLAGELVKRKKKASWVHGDMLYEFALDLIPEVKKEFDEAIAQSLREYGDGPKSYRQEIDDIFANDILQEKVFGSFYETLLETAIMQAEQGGLDFLVIESSTLSKNAVWNRANYRIMIDTPRNARHNKVSKRDDDISIKHWGSILDLLHDGSIKNAVVDYTLMHNYDKAKLQKQIEKLADKIAAGKSINIALPASSLRR
jgi:dephospho-CoA kinase